MGLDLAAANSGIAIIQAHGSPYSFTPLLEESLKHEMKDFRNRVSASNIILSFAQKYSVDFVVIEDYALRFGKNNTSGYQHGELGGMVRKVLHEEGFPIFILPPTTMRSFMGAPPRSDKKYLEELAQNRFDYKSTASNQTKRSNITDAVIHAHIGSLVYFSKHKKLSYDLTDKEDRVLNGAKDMVGLVDREGLFYEQKNR